MKKLIIIGNGFDVAHNHPTTYSDLMNQLVKDLTEFKENSGERITEQGLSPQGTLKQYKYIPLMKERGDLWIGGFENSNGTVSLKALSKNITNSVYPKDVQESVYFKPMLANYESTGNWSNIESLYFSQLKSELKKHPNRIKQLNLEFKQMKELLVNHLKRFEYSFKGGIVRGNPMYRIMAKIINDDAFQDVHIVSFNYTTLLLNQYLNALSQNETLTFQNPIHIHGTLNSGKNKVIFGYGDDNSQEYKNIQNANYTDSFKEELLKNFKTFQYARTNNYQHILGILEEKEPLYVQVIGHSCDMSDKTLLKTIFEHPNVKKIEAVYHKDESEYFKKLYKISQIFDDNALMREKMISLEDTEMIT